MSRTWSVEVAPDYNDDLFIGAYEECVEFIKDMEYDDDVDYQISEIEIDEEGCFTFCYETVKKEDIEVQ